MLRVIYITYKVTRAPYSLIDNVIEGDCIMRKTTARDMQPGVRRMNEVGRVAVKFFWKFSLIASIILSILGTFILNLIF